MDRISPVVRLVVEHSGRGWNLVHPDRLAPIATAGLQTEVLQLARRMLRSTGGEIVVQGRRPDQSRTLVVIAEGMRSGPSVPARRGDPWSIRCEDRA